MTAPAPILTYRLLGVLELDGERLDPPQDLLADRLPADIVHDLVARGVIEPVQPAGEG